MLNFNLIDEPWLPCANCDNSVSLRSVRDVLTHADEIRELLGNSPPETIALHRFLLAVLHRALNAPQNYEHWNQFWEARGWDAGGELNTYLSNWQHRFDLFDNKYPFYQTGSLEREIQNGAVIQLYFQAKANGTLFDHSATTFPREVSASEAARLLITFHAFDVGGIKADGAGGKRAPLLNKAIALVRGATLFETLALNFHCYSEIEGEPFPFKFETDLPPWERNDETTDSERLALGYVDLLTWQSRRILLQPIRNDSGEIVVENAVIMKGLFFPKAYEIHNKEPMMAFCKSKKEGFYYVGFSESKALWRNSLSLLHTVEGEQYRPKILDWLNELTLEGYLDSLRVFSIDFYGMKNDSKNEAKLLFWQQESFKLPLVILDSLELVNDLRIAIQFSEATGDCVYAATKSLATLLIAPESDMKNAKQPDPESVSRVLKGLPALDEYWSSLEVHFSSLLVNLPFARDSALREWFHLVDESAIAAFQRTADRLSNKANEIKAAVKANGLLTGLRWKLREANATYQHFLPAGKSHGGS